MPAPDWGWPRRVLTLAHDHMHVQLTDDVTQGRDVQFVRVERVLERFRQRGRFLPQLLLICDIQLKYLADILAAWHQDEPGIVRIVGQQQPAEWEIPDR